jgi:hypothetical protein
MAPVVLYVDESDESREAKRLLEQAGVSPIISHGQVDLYQRTPLLLCVGATFQGLDGIKTWLSSELPHPKKR